MRAVLDLLLDGRFDAPIVFLSQTAVQFRALVFVAGEDDILKVVLIKPCRRIGRQLLLLRLFTVALALGVAAVACSWCPVSFLCTLFVLEVPLIGHSVAFDPLDPLPCGGILTSRFGHVQSALCGHLLSACQSDGQSLLFIDCYDEFISRSGLRQ